MAKVLLNAKEADVDDPELPRPRKRPIRYEDGILQKRTFQQLLKMFIGQYILKLWIFQEELALVSDFYGDDFSKGQLRMQLGVLSSNIPSDTNPHDLCSVLQFIRGLLTDSQ